MNYDEASDFEINKAVAEALGYSTRPEVSSYGVEYTKGEKSNASGREIIFRQDYCNNPYQMCPSQIPGMTGGNCSESGFGQENNLDTEDNTKEYFLEVVRIGTFRSCESYTFTVRNGLIAIP